MGLLVENVSKSFMNKKAVDNISFKIEKPGLFALLGTNGAGKTTTIRMMLGIINKDSGTISWNGQEVSRKAVNFGYLPEERGIYPKAKIVDQLVYFAKLKGLSKTKSIENVDYWLKKLEMTEYKNELAEKLSKGNQQKIQFITAVMHDPELIVLDEPFSGLDPVNTEMLKKVISELVDKGKYIVMSSHQMNSIEEMCKDIVILNKGKTILKGNLQQIKEEYEVKKIELKTKNDLSSIINKNGLKIISQNEDKYIIEVDGEAQAEGLLKKITMQDIFIEKFELLRPTLNEIFIEKVENMSE